MGSDLSPKFLPALRVIKQAFGTFSDSLKIQYRRVVGGIGLFGWYVWSSKANQRLNTAILNLIVIQYQSIDVSLMYSRSLRVPLNG